MPSLILAGSVIWRRCSQRRRRLTERDQRGVRIQHAHRRGDMNNHIVYCPRPCHARREGACWIKTTPDNEEKVQAFYASCRACLGPRQTGWHSFEACETPPGVVSRIVKGLWYSTKTAILLARDISSGVWWNEYSNTPSGRTFWLYRTPRKQYFIVTRLMGDKEGYELEPCYWSIAQEFFERSKNVEQLVSYEVAFPNIKIQDA